MYIRQIYTNCLAQAAYYVESENEAVIIDPLRNPEPYIALARERGATIKYVLETHFHADFVSGHIDLANKTGATIVFGPGATPGYKAYIANDGDWLRIGKVQMEVVHTPGHTIESTCYLLHNDVGDPYAIFTGDTLFVGDVGRPDLLSGNLNKEELATMLFDSLQKKIKVLSNDIIVYPGHGPGSACGKNIGPEALSTIGREKLFNYAMKITSKEEFINTVTTDLPGIPGYFFTDAYINRKGYSSFDDVLSRGLQGISVELFNSLREKGAVVLDTRDPREFENGFITGAVNIGLNGDFAVWAGTFISPDASIILVSSPGSEHEAVERLARIGYDNIQGYLLGGMPAWIGQGRHYETIVSFNGVELGGVLAAGGYDLLDVRNRREVAKDRIAGSVHIPLNELVGKYLELSKAGKWLVYCAGGYRSMVAVSFLRSKGFSIVANVQGGINHVRETASELIELGLETE